MCGLYTVRTTFTVVFGRRLELATPPAYKVLPGDNASIVRMQGSEPECVAARWGYRPGWAEKKQAQINARAERVAASPMFRDSLRQRRCLVVADGFFEPDRVSGTKRYYWFRCPGDAPFAFAGIWTRFERAGEPAYDNYAIITTEPNQLVATIHPRMPVILPDEAQTTWLDPDCTDPANLTPLLRSAPDALLDACRVSDNLYRLAAGDKATIEAIGN